jgi:formate dehydrogenase major subunit
MEIEKERWPVKDGIDRAAKLIRDWPVVRQIGGADRLGLGSAVRSRHSLELKPRISDARVVKSVCPFCAVGCGQRVFVQDGVVTQIEGDPDSPISRGRLCPKGASSRELVNGPLREYAVKYRAPYSRSWREIPVDQAMEMIADRVIKTRAENWEASDEQGRVTKRTMAIGSLGGATLDNEENYLIKKLFTSLGIVQIENQARI